MMNKSAMISMLLAPALVVASTAEAGTPDGQNPAQEGICDSLAEDGVTKGLYGLCVAFCEAQDIASPNQFTTEEDLDRLLAGAPSGKILDAYNRKKQESDPDMPCIVVDDQESCPCWTGEQLDGIGTYFADSTLSCGQVPFFNGTYVTEANGSPNESAKVEAGAFLYSDFGLDSEVGYCSYTVDDPGTETFYSTALSTLENTLTADEAAACLEQVNAYCGYIVAP
jgi:hypothetical protein